MFITLSEPDSDDPTLERWQKQDQRKELNFLGSEGWEVVCMVGGQLLAKRRLAKSNNG